MSKQVKLRILQTSDVHGYVTPNHYSTMEEQSLGMAKISSLVSNLRTKNTILIDSGDIIQGSPLMHYQSKHHKDKKNPMASIMNHMGYDFATIGNHEFNYGIDYLKGYTNNLDATILSANIIEKDSHKSPFGLPYFIKEIEGIKIGIIGITTHYIPNWENPSNILNLDFLDAYSVCKHYVEILKPQVDFIIVNYHGGFEADLETGELLVNDTGENQGYRMLSKIEGINVLLTGHQHQVIAGIQNNIAYTQPGNNGKYLGMVDVVFEKNNHQITHQMHSQLVSVKGINPDPEIMNIIHTTESKTQQFLDIEIGHLETPLLISDQLDARFNKHKIVSFINQVQMEITGAPISSCSLGNDVSGFNQSITIRDIIGTYIYPNTLVVKSLSGAILKKAIEKSASFFELENNKIIISKKYTTPKLELYAYDMYDGIDYTIDIRKPVGERVIQMTYQGKPIKPQETYQVVMNNYRASGGGGYEFIQESPLLKDPQIEVIDALITYIENHKMLTINHKNNITILPKKD
jgi:2',3'-cyclic-nucleotide 2'-phosphodiesterase/3'-nucleotidase